MASPEAIGRIAAAIGVSIAPGKGGLETALQIWRSAPQSSTAATKEILRGLARFLSLVVLCNTPAMYNPGHFREENVEAMHALIRERPLAVLVTNGTEGPEASHVPMILDAGARVLRCHLARANPHHRAIAETGRVLAIFRGPEHYISPSWYPSKAAHGKVVPTWNYAAMLQARRGSSKTAMN